MPVSSVIDLARLGSLGLAALSLSACTQSDLAQAGAVVERTNPPYFLLADGCELPSLTPDMAALQTAVMETLAEGFPHSELDVDVIEGGATLSFQCGNQGSIEVDPLRFYLVNHNLKPTVDETCKGGAAYTGWISSVDPSWQYSDTPKIQCAAMRPVKTGEYAVKVCALGADIKAVEIAPRTASPSPVGITVADPEKTCPPNR